MLPKENRLPKTDFKTVLKKGKRIHTDYLVMLLLGNTNTKTPQLGVIASLKVGKAVKRNLVKRRMQGIFKKILPNITPNSQIIVICKPAITSLPFQQLQKEILTTLKKGNLYKR